MSETAGRPHLTASPCGAADSAALAHHDCPTRSSSTAGAADVAEDRPSDLYLSARHAGLSRGGQPVDEAGWVQGLLLTVDLSRVGSLRLAGLLQLQHYGVYCVMLQVSHQHHLLLSVGVPDTHGPLVLD